MWACPVAVPGALLLIPVALVLERRRLEKAKRAFPTERQDLPDAEFLRLMQAESDRAPLYLAARQVMAGLCGVGPAMVYPEDTLGSLLDLQFDNGFIQDLVCGLEKQADISVQGDPFAENDLGRMTFGAFLKILVPRCERVARIVLRLDPKRLRNPDWSIRHALPDLIAECSGGAIRSDGHGPSADKTALLLFLRAERLDQALACITEVVEKIPVLDNDLRSAVVAGLQRPDGYEGNLPA